MPRPLSLLVFLIIIFYLFWMDRKKVEGVSRAVWIPFLWIFFAATRYVSHWLNLGAPQETVDIYLEGNPVNAASFFILIVAGVIVLFRRRLNWSELLTKNKWVCLLFIFGIISFFWSDYPFVSFKRWIKTIGNVVMALVILTEERPYEAIGVIFRRLAFICIPISVLFIKYFPELGRAYHRGHPMATGIAFQKNSLGQICLFSGIYFSWIILINKVQAKRLHISIYLIILPMIVWLFYMAKSATSLVSMVVAVCLFLVGRMPAMAMKPRRIIIFGITCILLFGVMEQLFNIKAGILELLGRDETLTTRTEKWEVLLSMVKDPILGYGWEGFWLGERQRVAHEKIGLMGNAHNGYLEMYLNLGLAGLFILAGWIFSGLIKISRQLVIDYPAAMLGLCFIVVFALYNWTEAAFYGVSVMGVLLLLGSLDIPNKKNLLIRRQNGIEK